MLPPAVMAALLAQQQQQGRVAPIARRGGWRACRPVLLLQLLLAAFASTDNESAADAATAPIVVVDYFRECGCTGLGLEASALLAAMHVRRAMSVHPAASGAALSWLLCAVCSVCYGVAMAGRCCF